MAKIRHIQIKNFRSLKFFEWCPNDGFNCLIGPGDAGKSTILDAIDLSLGVRRSFAFTDSDFYQSKTVDPIEIRVTLGALNDDLLNIELYGMFLRAFESLDEKIYDEPLDGCETVITIQLKVCEDLEADWSLYSDRATDANIERRLQWKHRELIAAARLGVTANYHLAWGNRSLLSKVSGKNVDFATELSQLSRKARDSFAENTFQGLENVLRKIKEMAQNLGVSVGDLKALLDAGSVSLSQGAISLHNNDDTPLRQLGTGSSRLLISGLQRLASTSDILLVDEAEYGLEPYRITRLLNELGSKSDDKKQQVFITTHSPHVLRELSFNQICVVRKNAIAPPPPVAPPPPMEVRASHKIFSANCDDQNVLRVCSEAFFNKSVIICEGKTEIGILRGIDLYQQDKGNRSFQSYGVYYADGGGNNMFKRTKVYSDLGYFVALLKDSDKSTEELENVNEVKAMGVDVFEWGNNYSIEDAIVNYCPADVILGLLSVAIEWKSIDSVNDAIMKYSNSDYTLDQCRSNFNDSMRSCIAIAANKGKWCKDIEPAEQLARKYIAPNYHKIDERFRVILNGLFRWAGVEQILCQ